ncbi:hypothetical protein C8J57DRAFT_1233057 [Mycena rebaudengoi]|nr:hypothetical protein C8J57DRAFT_1233057 [Mycena rebaudengoi]
MDEIKRWNSHNAIASRCQTQSSEPEGPQSRRQSFPWISGARTSNVDGAFTATRSLGERRTFLSNPMARIVKDLSANFKILKQRKGFRGQATTVQKDAEVIGGKAVEPIGAQTATVPESRRDSTCSPSAGGKSRNLKVPRRTSGLPRMGESPVQRGYLIGDLRLGCSPNGSEQVQGGTGIQTGD